MQGIGGFLVLLGAGSFVLNMLGREFVWLMWIDTWGPTAGTAIRVGLIVVGAGLWLVGMRGAAGEAEDQAGGEAPPS